MQDTSIHFPEPSLSRLVELFVEVHFKPLNNSVGLVKGSFLKTSMSGLYYERYV